MLSTPFSVAVVLAGWLSGPAQAASAAPSRQIPPSVLVELELLQNRFALALASDCDAQRCFSKGCSYVDHAVADRPRSGSMPGLGQSPGPDAASAQSYLTRARCSYAHEPALEPADLQALNQRLQARLSSGWTVVSVDNQPLVTLPDYLRQPPVPELSEADLVEPQAQPVVQEQPWTAATAGAELWTTLLPHFFWMIAIGLCCLAGIMLIWAWRRVGRVSVEDQALLAELARPQDADGVPPAADDVETAQAQAQATFVAERSAAWSARLDGVGSDGEPVDPQLQALIRELLRSGDQALLAKAVLSFPDSFLAAFPSGGDLATAKLDLAHYLKTVDASTLPSDVDFFESLDRHALAAALSSQSDAQVVASLREDFGAVGLVEIIGQLPPRLAALLFALAPAVEQVEMVRLLSGPQVNALAEQLLLSNRMDPAEGTHLFQIVSLARGGATQLPVPQPRPVTDRGAAFDATGALCVLLPVLAPARRESLFAAALQRYSGSLPGWYRGILLPQMLFALSAEARVDLLLEIDVDALAAWLSVLDGELRGRLVPSMPDALRSSVGAASVFSSRTQQLALAARGRQALARGFQLQLARARVPFETVVQQTPVVDP